MWWIVVRRILGVTQQQLKKEFAMISIIFTVLYLKWSLKVGIGRFLQGGGLIFLNLPGTSTRNEFWVISLIGKFIAVHLV
jgi:hypothetical protein